MNQTLDNGCSALMLAAGNGHLKVVELLLEANAHPTVRNRAYKSALDLATAKGHTDIVNLLSTRLKAN